MSFRKVLIIQTAFPGDLILTTPLIRAIKENFPEAFVSILVIPQTKELLKNNPYLDQVITYDKKREGWLGFLSTLKRLKKEEFDLAVVPHRSLRSALLAYISCKVRVGFDKSVGKFLLTEQVTYKQDLHEIERNLSLLSFAGLKSKLVLPELFPGSEEFSKVEGFLRRHKAEFSDELVCIAPGSVWRTKRWLPERFAQVADWLTQREEVKVVISGSRQDFGLAEEMAGQMSAKSINTCGELSLLESAALFNKSRLVLSNDSAPTHLAVAMRTPVVTIFGSTVPEFGFYPYGEENEIVQRKLYCRPCGIHGRGSCPEGHFRCMKEISAEEVFEVIQRKLHAKRVQTG